MSIWVDFDGCVSDKEGSVSDEAEPILSALKQANIKFGFVSTIGSDKADKVLNVSSHYGCPLVFAEHKTIVITDYRNALITHEKQQATNFLGCGILYTTNENRTDHPTLLDQIRCDTLWECFEKAIKHTRGDLKSIEMLIPNIVKENRALIKAREAAEARRLRQLEKLERERARCQREKDAVAKGFVQCPSCKDWCDPEELKPHTCPYKTDIYQDYELCSCCECCQHQCSDER